MVTPLLARSVLRASESLLVHRTAGMSWTPVPAALSDCDNVADTLYCFHADGCEHRELNSKIVSISAVLRAKERVHDFG